MAALGALMHERRLLERAHDAHAGRQKRLTAFFSQLPGSSWTTVFPPIEYEVHLYSTSLHLLPSIQAFVNVGLGSSFSTSLGHRSFICR